jgi:hypothetical protein
MQYIYQSFGGCVFFFLGVTDTAEEGTDSFHAHRRRKLVLSQQGGARNHKWALRHRCHLASQSQQCYRCHAQCGKKWCSFDTESGSRVVAVGWPGESTKS